MDPDVQPVSHFAERTYLGTGRCGMTVLAYPKYYRVGSEDFRVTREAFRRGDAPLVAVATEGVHLVGVEGDGTVHAVHLGHEICFKLRSVVAASETGGQIECAAIDLRDWRLDLGRLDVGVVAWEHPTGAVYEVCYRADAVTDRLRFTPEFVAAWRRRLPVGGRFGLRFDWQMPAAFDVPDFSTERPVGMRLGTIRQKLAPSAFLSEGDDQGWQERWDYRSGVMVQTLPLDALDAVAEIRTEVTYQQGIDGYSGCTDAWLKSDNPDDNRDETTQLITGSYGPSKRRTLIRFDISSIPGGSTINSSTLGLYCFYNGAGGNVSAHMALKSWIETQVTWNSRQSGVAWGTPGCPANDDDAESAAQDTQSPLVDSWRSFDVKNAVQDWVDGTANCGLMLREPETVGESKYYPSEYATDTSKRPKLWVEYLTGQTYTEYAAADCLVKVGEDTLIGVTGALVGASSGQCAAGTSQAGNLVLHRQVEALAAAGSASAAAHELLALVQASLTSSGASAVNHELAEAIEALASAESSIATWLTCLAACQGSLLAGIDVHHIGAWDEVASAPAAASAAMVGNIELLGLVGAEATARVAIAVTHNLFSQSVAALVAAVGVVGKSFSTSGTTLIRFIPDGKNPVEIQRAFQRLLKLIENLERRVTSLES